MNVSNVQFVQPKQNIFFGAKIPDLKVKIPEHFPTDIMQIAADKTKVLPVKFGFTEVEELFKPIYVKYRVASLNAISQKENMKLYYTTQCKADYHDIMKEKRSLFAKLKRIAKKAGMDEYDMMFTIDLKNEYNRNSSKICKAKTKEDFRNMEELISSSHFYMKTKELLSRLLNQCKSSVFHDA